MNPFSWLSRRRPGHRLWLVEATGRMIETASRTSDILEILSLWCEEIAASDAAEHVAVFLSEGDRWLRVLPKAQTSEVPVVPHPDLSRVAAQRRPVIIPPMRPKDRSLVLAPFSARDSWSGAVALWRPSGGISSGQIRRAGELAAAIGRSLTVLRRAETSREEALAAERARWASELHDGFLQSLLSAKLHAEVCQTLEEEHDEVCLSLGQQPAPRLRRELARTRDLLEETVRQVRSFLLEQRSPPGTPEEFLPWLRDYADDFTRENGIVVDVRVEGSGELSKNQAGEVIRIVREALTNVRKHARASCVRVVVAYQEHGTAISISDDGVGFDVKMTFEQLLESSHNGLIGLRYRTESIGGILRVRSDVGKGTTLQLRLPKVQKRATSEAPARDRERPSAPDWDTETEAAPGATLPVQESIRAALADAISSLLEYEAPSPPRDVPR
ncbi:MAG TPA: ATP-binding protein [Thermoanaerobaculia bacterium]|nr:ATP-binding protein [Thermoanaerobaculia bacterium]